jgi:hypothetical protein
LGRRIRPGNPDLRGIALLAERYPVIDGSATAITGMFHRFSRYRSLRKEARKRSPQSVEK